MKISASVYSNTSRPLEELVKELDRYHVDYMHVDCIERPEVFEDIERIRSVSRTPIDLHIISAEPEKYFDGIKRTGVELVTFQMENLQAPLQIEKKNFNGTRFGLAMTSGTPVGNYLPYKNSVDFVLLMATTPGKSGGSFDHVNFKKIREFKTQFPGTRIHVDGGVNGEISFVLRTMGVSLVVSGSYLVNSDYMGAALHNLRSDTTTSHVRIGDFMIGRESSPVLVSPGFSFHDVLQSIEKFNMGFTMVCDSSGKLEGMITNADVRRGLLKHPQDLNTIDVNDIINRKPVTINLNNTVEELLKMVRGLNFPVLFLPVTDEEGKVAGTITFNNLIKGES